MGWGVRLGLHLVKGIGEQHEALLDAERARGPYRSLADVVERTGLPEEVLERLIRSGAMDSLGRPRRELLWQLREVAGASRGRVDGRALRALGRAAGKRGAAAGRPMDLRLPATDAPATPRDHRVGADRRCLRGPRRGCPPPGRGPVPAGAGSAGGGDERGPRRPAAGAGPGRWPGRHPPAPDDGQGHGLPGARGRDRDGQRDALAERVGAAARGRPAARAAARGRGAAARGLGREPRRARGPATPRGGRRGRWPGTARAASARWVTPGCGGSADRRGARGASASAAERRAFWLAAARLGRRCRVWPAACCLPAIRARQLQEPAIPGGRRGEERAHDRRDQEAGEDRRWLAPRAVLGDRGREPRIEAPCSRRADTSPTITPSSQLARGARKPAMKTPPMAGVWMKY